MRDSQSPTGIGGLLHALSTSPHSARPGSKASEGFCEFISSSNEVFNVAGSFAEGIVQGQISADLKAFHCWTSHKLIAGEKEQN